MGKGKILVTPRSLSKAGHPELTRLEEAGFDVITPYPGRQPTPEELVEVLPDCVGYLAGVERIDGDLLARCSGLKVISRNGVGVDNVDKVAAEQAGIVVATTPGANARGVAELAVALMFAMLRFVPQTNQSVKSGRWERVKGREVAGRTIGVVGTGQVGQKVVGMATGVGMRALGYDPYPVPGLEEEISEFRYASLDQLLSSSDVVTLHCPAGEKPLVDRKVLTMMKGGACLVNTARASLVDTDAVFAALESGALSGYAIDAFEIEPPELTPLLQHPRTILTAHIGGYTEESVSRATAAAVDNVLDVLI